ncbi:MAG TPA: tetratricopeptide repeat protein [Kofleriaceae bacterium]|jgi:tetratricopeptide (TPR) repeat protein
MIGVRHALFAAFLVAAATSAHADIWHRALTNGDAAHDVYDDAMRRGDDAAAMTRSVQISLSQTKLAIQRAIESYRAAAAARPDAAEPYYRIGLLLDKSYFDCGVSRATPMGAPLTCDGANWARGREALAAWDKFEQLSPLDPRVDDLLGERAILRTKIYASDPRDRTLLEAAARDYEASLARADGFSFESSTLGNLAETYMMLGDLDKAIEKYREARAAGAPGSWSSVTLGLAVALDRDERGDEALALIHELSRDALEDFVDSVVRAKTTFFVPEGEEHYYFGLIDESIGDYRNAAREWSDFIASGAHPEYQPRAKAHIEAIVHGKLAHVPPRRDTR